MRSKWRTYLLVLGASGCLVLGFQNCLNSNSTNSSGPATSQSNGPASTSSQADVLIYGATSSGIIAAVEASRLGKKVLLLDQNSWIGGMTANGLGFTDTGVPATIGGLAQEFYQRINAAYGGAPGTSRFTFSPHIALQVYQDMLDGAQVVPLLNSHIASVQKSGATIQSVTLDDGSQYTAQEFIDATYEGDLLALSKVSYVVGRESSAEFNESLAGVGAPIGFPVKIDPYVVPGDSSSGLLSRITGTSIAPVGSGDKNVMAYDYRLCVTNNPANGVPFTIPENYSSVDFELLARYSNAMTAAGTPLSFFDIITVIPVETDGQYFKGDMNNSGLAADLVSTDDVGLSVSYPNGSVSLRQTIAAEHRHYMQALFYFVQTSTSIPASVRSQMSSIYLCKDEFNSTGNWPPQLYVREARRMRGEYVLSQNDMLDAPQLSFDPIAIGSYSMDSHWTQRLALNGSVYGEGYSYTGIPVPYGIPYASLVPLASEANNLLVSAAISATHQAYKSIRLEPVYMMMGHGAGAAASLAIDQKVSVQQVDYSALSAQLLKDKQILTWVDLFYLNLIPNGQNGLSVNLYGSFPGPGSLYNDPSNFQSWARCANSPTGAKQPSVSKVTYSAANKLTLTLNFNNSQPMWCDYHVSFATPTNSFSSNTLSSIPTQVSGSYQIQVEGESNTCISPGANGTLITAICKENINFTFQEQGDGSYLMEPQIGSATILFGGSSQLMIKINSSKQCLNVPASGINVQINQSGCISSNANEKFLFN